jgi:hypothetical protein
MIACVAAIAWGIPRLQNEIKKKNPVPVGNPTAPPEGEGWIDLLDAEHAPYWENIGDEKEIFEIADGQLHLFGVSKSKLRYATYNETPFDNFDLHVEFKVAEGTNSGLFLRAQPNDKIYRGFEVQIFDDFGAPPTNKETSGAIYDVVTPMYNLSRPAGEWNSFDISVLGHDVSIRLNGWLVTQANFELMTTPLGKFKIAYKDMPPLGHIAFQDHGGEAWFRNVRVRPVELDEY